VETVNTSNILNRMRENSLTCDFLSKPGIGVDPTPFSKKIKDKLVTLKEERAANKYKKKVKQAVNMIFGSVSSETAKSEINIEQAVAELGISIPVADLVARAQEVIRSSYRRVRHVKKKRTKIKQKKRIQKNKESKVNYSTRYLKQPLWVEVIRPRILDRDNYCCRVCNSADNLQVHHRSYRKNVMRGNDDEKLITLCCKHHIEIEFAEYYGKDDDRNMRRTKCDVEAKLLELLSLGEVL
jgi:hypothetical protein